MMLEMNNKRKKKKTTKKPRPHGGLTMCYQTTVTEEIKQEIKNTQRLNENSTIQNLWHAAKEVLGGSLQ